MTITVWNDFQKRKNSTLQPSTKGSDITVVLKEGTSIEKPIFLLTGNDFTINYVKAFDHYYFVDDIKAVRNDLSEIACSMDVLATFKTDIGNYTAMVERSSYSYDTDYPDPAVSIQNDIIHSESTVKSSMFVSGGGYGCYVLSVLNDIGSGTGFTTTYILDATELEECAKFVNTDWGSAATDILAWLKSVFLKTADSIIDCIWMPISSSVYTSSSLVSYETLRIGVTDMTGVGIDVKGYRLLYPFIATENLSIVIPHHYSDFRKYAPYTNAILKLPGIGATAINTLDFKKNDTIKIGICVDMSTGDTFVAVMNDDSKLVSTYTYNVGVSCPVGKVGTDVTGTLAGYFNTIGAFANMRAMPQPYQFGARMHAEATAVNTIAAAAGVTASVHGSKGGRAIFREAEVWVDTFARVTSNPADLLDTSGRVCMQSLQLSTIPGYIKCINASVQIAGMSEEKDAVNDFLNNGFYYE